MQTTKQKVYKRPMTAINMWRQRQSHVQVYYEKISSESDPELSLEEVKIDEDEDEEIHVKEKITKDEPMPVNVVSFNNSHQN